jgi:hypothetical protein
MACRERLQQVIPPANTRPVRVFSQDESRFGLLTIRRRRLTARGVQPLGSVQQVFEWCYVYGAVEPTTGERFFLELPYLTYMRPYGSCPIHTFGKGSESALHKDRYKG